MADYMTLMGAEQVQTAGYVMREAAAGMDRAAYNFGGYVEQMQRAFDAHEQNMRDILESHAARIEAAMKGGTDNGTA